jgi:hypothetical protein
MVEEIWKSIEGFPGYDVSNYGRVRSYWKKLYRGYMINNTPIKILKQTKGAQGYLIVSLKKDHIPYTSTVHRLVLSTFHGPCPEGMECCHSDGTRYNNHIDNLRWDTYSNNNLDKLNHGTSRRISRELIEDIINHRSNNLSAHKIAKLCNVNKSTVLKYTKNVPHIPNKYTAKRYLKEHQVETK